MADSKEPKKKRLRKKSTKDTTSSAQNGDERGEQHDLIKAIGRGVVSPVLRDPDQRAKMGLPRDEDEPGRYMVELNILYRGGLRQASQALQAVQRRVRTGASGGAAAYRDIEELLPDSAERERVARLAQGR